MTGQPNDAWYLSLPAAEAPVPCGTGAHAVRWEAGRLLLPAHPDAEGELVLAALGGEKAGCVELAEIWGKHVSDLEMLIAGPRSAADLISITWDDVTEFRSSTPTSVAMTRRAGGPFPSAIVGRVGAGAFGGGPGARRQASFMSAPGSPGRISDQLRRFQAQRLETLTLLALGPALQFRLSGTVAAAWADGGTKAAEQAAHRPALTAALAGRLAPAAHAWLGIDPDQVTVTLHEGPGWGALEVTGSGPARQLRAALPVGWLPTVWACGLAVADGHLVVAVERPGWPEARVLALPAPDAAPLPLTLRADPDPADGQAGLPHWRAITT
jgi:hypothetical protein